LSIIWHRCRNFVIPRHLEWSHKNTPALTSCSHREAQLCTLLGRLCGDSRSLDISPTAICEIFLNELSLFPLHFPNWRILNLTSWFAGLVGGCDYVLNSPQFGQHSQTKERRLISGRDCRLLTRVFSYFVVVIVVVVVVLLMKIEARPVWLLRTPYCLHNRLTDGGKIVSLTHRPRSSLQKHYFSASDTNFF
jgi:hypothetical protein